MATCSPQELLGESSCFSCYPEKQLELIKLALLCRWLKILDPMASCSPQELLDDASCFLCLNPGDWNIIQTQLLCEILQAGGGGGNSCLLCGAVDPVDAPTCTCAIYYNTVTMRFFIWVGFWNPIIL